MRTTVTLDADVERLLRDAARRSGRSFKEVLNQAVREGLARATPPPRGGRRFRVEPRALGLRPGLDPAGFNRLLDELEAERSATASRPRRRATRT